MIYIDTCVIVAYINPRDPLHERSARALSKAPVDERVCSQVTVLELFSVLSRALSVSDEELEAAVEYSLRKTGASVVRVDWEKLYWKAIDAANKVKLRTLDLLHAVAAKLAGAEAVLTFDDDMLSKSKALEECLGIRAVSSVAEL